MATTAVAGADRRCMATEMVPSDP